MTDWTNKKGPGDVFKEGNKAADVMKKLTPRVVPMKFGYMRLAEGNPNEAAHRTKLAAIGVDKTFEDLKAQPFQRPNFDAMLAEARPFDQVFIVKLTHLSNHKTMIEALVSELCESRLDIRIVDPAYDGYPDSAALMLAFHRAVLDGMIRTKCGGDGGGGD